GMAGGAGGADFWRTSVDGGTDSVGGRAKDAPGNFLFAGVDGLLCALCAAAVSGGVCRLACILPSCPDVQADPPAAASAAGVAGFLAAAAAEPPDGAREDALLHHRAGICGDHLLLAKTDGVGEVAGRRLGARRADRVPQHCFLSAQVRLAERIDVALS